MSEFPNWVEDRIGWGHMTPEEGRALHRKLAVVYELIPDIDERMSRPKPRWPAVPLQRSWSWWKRYLWYVAQ